MKNLENKETELRKTETELTTYADLVRSVNDFTPEGGFNKSTMKLSLKIDEKLEQANGTIELEDAEAEYLKGIIAVYPWALKHKDVLAFVEAIENL
jgi:hypothetical protein